MKSIQLWAILFLASILSGCIDDRGYRRHDHDHYHSGYYDHHREYPEHRYQEHEDGYEEHRRDHTEVKVNF